MNVHQEKKFSFNILTTVLFTVFCFVVMLGTARADSLPKNVQTKVNTYEKKLAQWANDPAIIDAVKKANSQSTAMDNTKWKGLKQDDPQVMGYQTSAAGKKLTGWNQDKTLGKLFLRDKNGNLVAGSKKPAIFNIADRPAFIKAMHGKSWHSAKAKKDPTTKLSSVQLSHPIMENGKQIGVLHTSIIVE